VGAKVLIVDDEPDVAAYLAAALRANGHSPTVAHSAQTGLEQLRRSRPDLICLDIVMPRESGMSMYVRLKKNDDYRSIPIVIVSGVGQDGQLDFRNYVADESVPPPERYLEKPIKVDEFIATVEQLVASATERQGNK
jgi:two-component system, OmpR family, phosphate regulon response regulator PhoB